MTRFPALHQFLTGDTPNRKTPPSNRRGFLTDHGHQRKQEADDMVVSLARKTKPETQLLHISARPTLSEADQLKLWLERGQNEVFTVTTELTPNLAALLTQRNENNRPVLWKGPNRSVEAYARAMQRGEWRLNGAAIIVSRDGFLNDGQHRCYAVLDAQTGIPALLTFGVDRDTRHTVDQGIARSPGHILALNNEVNTNVLATALHMLWCLDQGVTLNARPSPDQLLATLERHPAIRECIPATKKLAVHYRLSVGYIASAHYLCRKYRAAEADLFLGDLTTGLNIKSVNSPVARLRRQFEEHSAKRKRIGRDEQAALYIKGFNNFLRNRQGALVWRNAGPAAESFPTVGA